MSFSFSSLIRLMVMLALGSTMVAVGLARLDPPRPTWRARNVAPAFNINEYYVDVTDRTPRWLDAETGRIVEGPLADGDVLEAASCSPWVDDRGHRQVIGRWSSRTEDGPMSMSKDFGLARYTYPGGEPLDHISTEIVPTSSPCWFPGTRARVVFTAGDGKLYRYAFEPQEGTPIGKGRDPRPTPLTWRCPRPGGGEVFLGDLTWPEDPRLGGCLVVSLRHQGVGGGAPRAFSRTQLWWLKLNHAGTEVVEAGRLIAPAAAASADEFEERSPNVATLPDGRIVLVYLRQRAGGTTWELRVAAIAIEGDRRTPSIAEAATRAVAEHYQAAHPAFSPDGRWLNAIVGDSHRATRTLRVRTESVLPPARAEGGGEGNRG